jgi:hypothetical protein
MAYRPSHTNHMKQILKHTPPPPAPVLHHAAPLKKQAAGKKYKKKAIPAALREQVWLKHCGRVFEHKCITPWCKNTICVFDFESGHNIPESKGGPTTLDNLVPLCRRCNNSMGDRYTFDEWARLETMEQVIGVEVHPPPPPPNRSWKRFFCFSKSVSQT